MPLPPPVQRVQPLPVVLADLVAADLQGRGPHAVLGGARLARHHEAADLLDLLAVAVDPVDPPADVLADPLPVPQPLQPPVASVLHRNLLVYVHSLSLRFLFFVF